MELSALGLPALLLLATWTAYGTVLNTFSLLNNTRNSVLGISSSPQPARFRRLILYSDWLPLWIGFSVALFLYTVVFAAIPAVVRDIESHNKDLPAWYLAVTKERLLGFSQLDFVCGSIAAFSAITALGNIVGGIADFIAMRTELRRS